MFLTKKQIEEARRSNLFTYLCRCHPEEFHLESGSLRMAANHSVSIRKDYHGFRDFATADKGNSIDFLTRYLGYEFHEAVLALTQSTPEGHPCSERSKKVFRLPQRSGTSDEVIRYLQCRGIPRALTEALIRQDLLYQEEGKKNAVFLSRKKDFAEVRGTCPNSVFHGVRKKAPDRFWAFCPGGPGEAKTAFVCEGAIDALSLYLLHLRTEVPFGAVYCGIAGVSNQKAIERIARFLSVILAVDNDEAGRKCRERNSEFPSILPAGKDWNEDLLAEK